MLLQYDSNKLINAYRRNQTIQSNSSNVNILNEPSYGVVTTDWTLLAASLPVLLDRSKDPVSYNPAGERVEPDYILYAPPSASLLEEDRIIDLKHFGSQSMYVVTSMVEATDEMGNLDHLELRLRMP